jgi:hypothetical protein
MLEYARKGTEWCVSVTDENGRMGEQDSINAYYKCPLPLRLMGHQAAAARVLNYVVGHFMSAEGDFYEKPDKRTSGTYTRLYCQHYPNEWFLRAAHALGNQQVFWRTQRFLMTSCDEVTGGFRSEANHTSPVLDVMSTAMGAFCSLLAGMTDTAESAAYFLRRLLAEQPDPSKYYIRWHPEEGFLKQPENPDHTMFYVIDKTQPGQAYWHIGMPIVTLAKLYEATEKKEYLEDAIKYYDFVMSCNPDVACSPPAGKLCWGSAVLYRLTGDKRYRDTNSRILEYFASLWHKDGHVDPPGDNPPGFDRREVILNFTAEFSTWFADSAAEIAGAG